MRQTTSTGAEVEMEPNNVVGDALSTLDYANEQLVLEEANNQESQVPTTIENEHGTTFGNPSHNQFQYPYDLGVPREYGTYLSLQNDLSVSLWSSFDYQSTLLDDHTNSLEKALNWETSMFQLCNENPIRAESNVLGSSRSSSTGSHSKAPEILQIEAPNPQVLANERYEPL